MTDTIVYDQYLYSRKPDVDDDIVVYHSGFCSTLPNYSYGKDRRDYYLLHYITQGKGTYNTGEKSYPLSKHDGFLILPGATIVHKADAHDPWDVCWVAFFGRKAEELLKAAGLDEDHLIFRYEKDDFLESCIKSIYSESRNGRNIAAINGYFYLFVGKLIEIHQEKSKGDRNKVAAFSHFDAALNFIKRNIHTGISVEDLAKYLRLDLSQVYRVFKKKTGLSPQQFIARMRMQKACELISGTDLSVREISEWLSFEYQSHFNKQFKKAVGVTPSEYRMRLLKKERGE